VHEPITLKLSIISSERIGEALDRHVDSSARIVTTPIRILLGRLHRQRNGLVVTFGELVAGR
jgi:hypothetical protein